MPPTGAAKKSPSRSSKRATASSGTSSKSPSPKRAKPATKGAAKGTTKSTKGTSKSTSKSAPKAATKGGGKSSASSGKPASGDAAATRTSGGGRNGGRKGDLRIVPDTSVLVDGRITIETEAGTYQGAEVIIAEATIAELESMANRGKDAGFNGLDELAKLQTLAAKGLIRLRFAGVRPAAEEMGLAESGEIDAMIRELAEAEEATLVTADKIQAQVAEAIGIPYRYLRVKDEASTIDDLRVTHYFSEGIMSVHLKQDVTPHAKRGTPGNREYYEIEPTRLTKRDLNDMAREIVEAARRDDRSFVEIERQGATVVQLRDMRIAISRPPFSDAIEITAVRPVAHLGIEDYDLPAPVLQRLTDHSRGVFVSGPPGSGKSTFAQAVAEHLHDMGVVVKTMESPRDLQLPDAITQYAPLERDIELTGDFLLLVRPDFVVYDEVRKTRDFEVFADMRLAGVGLIGVTHANRAIDAVQRLIGRVELGMIPQVVDTVVHIIGGRIEQILEMDFTVRVPSGMTEADLARPVIRVRDFQNKQELFEIYTYGEQVVVMPIGAGATEQTTGASRLAQKQLEETLGRYIEGRYDVDMAGPNRAVIYVEEWAIAGVIGRGGSRVQELERRLGIKLDIKTLRERPGGKAAIKPKSVEAQWADEERTSHGGEEGLILPRVRILKKSVVLDVGPEYGGLEAAVEVDGRVIGQGHLSNKGEMRVNRKAPEAKRLLSAHKEGSEIVVRLV